MSTTMTANVPGRIARGALLWWLLAAGLVAPVAAQDDKRVSREREALRRSQQALQAAQTERDTLLRDKASWARDKAALDAALLQARGQAQSQAAASAGQLQTERARTAQLQAGADAAARAVQEWRQALQVAESRSADLARQLASAQAALGERTRTLASVNALLERSTQRNAAADDKNRKLHALSRDLIEQVRARTGTEPVLGLGRVELENWAEEQRDRVDAERVR